MQQTTGRLAVIFDMDGVLIDSADAHLRSWHLLAEELDFYIAEERFLETFGQRNEDVLPSLFGSGRSAEEIHALGERKEALYRDLVRGRMPVIDGAVKLVRDCAAAGFKLAVGSSGPPENIALALDELAVKGLFDVVVSGEDVSVGKPDPAVFLLASERLQVPPKRCVVIEDAPSGVAAALAAGMAAVGLTITRAAEELASADLLVSQLAELTPAVLADLLRWK